MEATSTNPVHPGLLLDDEHPWPGLLGFSEANREFFRGREKEVEDLARLIRQEPLTVLFGRSGLGKSSILRAGISPVLREDSFVPIYIRLSHAEEAPPLAEQVQGHIARVLEEEGIDAPRPVSGETPFGNIFTSVVRIGGMTTTGL